MANETMTVNRLPALTWNWLKMNAARLEANAPAVGAAPSFVQTAQLARSSAAQDWAWRPAWAPTLTVFWPTAQQST